MANYIDKDKLTRDLIDNRSFYPAIVKNAIENAPTEDVVPRSEVEELQKQLNDYKKFVGELIVISDDCAIITGEDTVIDSGTLAELINEYTKGE